MYTLNSLLHHTEKKAPSHRTVTTQDVLILKTSEFIRSFVSVKKSHIKIFMSLVCGKGFGTNITPLDWVTMFMINSVYWYDWTMTLPRFLYGYFVSPFRLWNNHFNILIFPKILIDTVLGVITLPLHSSFPFLLIVNNILLIHSLYI